MDRYASSAVATTTTATPTASFQLQHLQQPHPWPHHHQQQIRWYDHNQHSKDRRLEERIKAFKDDPFRILGFQNHTPDDDDSVLDDDDENRITYKQVKTAFLQIAKDYHPDTSPAESDEELERHREIFIRARKAFEQIIEGPNGRAVLKTEKEKAWDDAHLNKWYFQQTGMNMPFMDFDTMKEVAEMVKDMGAEQGGLDRDGGMWQLARTVASNVKAGHKDMSFLKLDAGKAPSGSAKSQGHSNVRYKFMMRRGHR